MQLAYVAHSERCALLLDEDGICRWIVPKVDEVSVVAGAKRCIGAQFVATLDPEATGLLGHDPSIGKSILLARVDDGRVSLVRFGPLVQFDTVGGVLDREAPQPPAPAPAPPEPKTAELPRLVLVPDFVPDFVPDPRASEPATVPGRPSACDDHERETARELDDEDDLQTGAGERLAYRPSGFIIRAAAASDVENVENVETTQFARATLISEPRRGILPRRR